MLILSRKRNGIASLSRLCPRLEQRIFPLDAYLQLPRISRAIMRQAVGVQANPACSGWPRRRDSSSRFRHCTKFQAARGSACFHSCASLGRSWQGKARLAHRGPSTLSSLLESILFSGRWRHPHFCRRYVLSNSAPRAIASPDRGNWPLSYARLVAFPFAWQRLYLRGHGQ